VVVVSYFGSNLSSQVSTLESIQPLFLFHYLDSTAGLFKNGPQANDVLILLVVALVAFIWALIFFQLRDITVGAWPWQRGKIPAEANKSG
jgi:ABC-2 type transport system permease protein